MSEQTQNLLGIAHSTQLEELINDVSYKESLKKIFNVNANRNSYAKFVVSLENIVFTFNALIFNLIIYDKIEDKYIFENKNLHISIHDYNSEKPNQSHIKVKTGEIIGLYFKLNEEGQIIVYSYEPSILKFLKDAKANNLEDAKILEKS
jgi:hypothetical protein